MKSEKSNLKIPTTNNQTPKSIKGITLVALVVTIVILIILAGVTLNIVLDQNGIIAKAREGANKYHNAQINEQLQISDAESYIDEWTSNIPSELKNYILGANGNGRNVFEIVEMIDETTVVFIDEETTIPDASTSVRILNFQINEELFEIYILAEYKGKAYKITVGVLVTDDGEQFITKKIEEPTVIGDKFRQYILGPLGIGRPIIEIMNDLTSFKDEETTIPDASTSIRYICDGSDTDLGYIYIRYKHKMYKVTINVLNYNTQNVEEINILQGNEGRIVGYDTNGNGTTEEDERWIVITDRGGTFEIASSEPMGSLTLGSGDTTVTVTEDLDGDETIGDDGDIAIASYNNAITTINNYCKTLVNSKDGEEVRSLGASSEVEGNYYSSTEFNSLFKGKVSVKAGDEYYEQDWEKVKWAGGMEYIAGHFWVASRNASGDIFYIRNVATDSDRKYMKSYDNNIWWVKDDGSVVAFSPSLPVVPVVINPIEFEYID